MMVSMPILMLLLPSLLLMSLLVPSLLLQLHDCLQVSVVYVLGLALLLWTLVTHLLYLLYV